ncbi:[Fe-Fe] hydrogenase large subunit C-terminal domain-containing protein [Holophaga foetida]|uniref:[Fe-Fe] hydrogenase large subunit C-terminal domain-containing protein n=1 Tax=Holophaga foetida TaxID=35839 RepID=UPI00024721B6|nr:[Fe-Fe] hydrogenase large subunit C-terminal domain-containing protein [Holophaga foetida]
MNFQKPIYTEQGYCRDCYKCIRHCPVKAIRVENNQASIIPERCIYCGICVDACPVGAKRVRDDLNRAKLLVRRKDRVVASLAPSFISEFSGIRPGQLIHALKMLGFHAVSETALGAQEVSAACAELARTSGNKLFISTTCPSVVELIQKYYPGLSPYLTPFLSTMAVHARMLKREFGGDTGIVYLSPCIAKQLESDDPSMKVDVALTFTLLRQWFEDLGIVLNEIQEDPEDIFLPEPSRDGALYPISGGMLQSMEVCGGLGEVKTMAFSGVQQIMTALEGIHEAPFKDPLFLELLACDGGCVNGPRSHERSGTASKMLEILRYARIPEPGLRLPTMDIRREFSEPPVETREPLRDEMAAALHRLGKSMTSDELDCGGCGYDTCRALAAAMVDGRAEVSMCVAYMRKLASNKANALMRSMPCGVVIVDESMDIVECNRKFAEILGGDVLTVFDAKPGMAGADITKVAPFHRLFRTELEDGKAVMKDLRVGGLILRVSVFTIEPGRVVGGIVYDITEPLVERGLIIQKAEEVIRKNVTTVQQIAYLLGENAAETEMILASIIDSFKVAPDSTGNGKSGR